MNSIIESLTNLIIKEGAINTGIVDIKDIKFNKNFRKQCESNQCGMYNKNWTCPPSIGDIDDLINKAKTYDIAIVYQTITEIEDSFDIEGMLSAGQRQNSLSISINRELKKYNLKSYLHLSAGGCKICDKCAKIDNLECRYPELAIPSLESHGISVYDLAKSCNLNYINGPNTVTYFSAILIKLS